MTTRHPHRKGKVIFVGEDRELWFELHREISPAESPWELVFTHTAAQALVTMAKSTFDAVVADSELPDMDGLRFLNEVMKRHPETLRFIRAPIAANRLAMRFVGTPHQHLLKPGNAQTVFAALSRAIKFQAWLPSGAVQILLSGLHKLPSAPKLYFQVVADLQSPEASVESVGALIAQDMAMTAKLLQLANSALFGLQRQVSHPAEAVLYLGMETTKSVLLLAHSFSYFDRIRVEDFSIDALWNHSLQTGKFAQKIASDSGAGTEIASQSFTAGMLHDIGKLALAANLPEKFGQAVALARTKKAQLSETETEVIGASHAELGACLLATWGLPAPVVEAVALHHYPVQLLSRSFCPLTAVHVANGLNHETEPADRDRASSTVDRRYLSQMNLSGRLDEWRALCLEPARRAEA